MVSTYSSPEAFLTDALNRAQPVLQRRLGSVGAIDLKMVESLIDSSTFSDDPLEVLALRKLRVALIAQKDHKLPSEGEIDKEKQFIQLYRHLLGKQTVHKGLVFELARELRSLQLLSTPRCLVFCEGENAAASSVVTRAIRKVTAHPMEIDVSRELRGDDPLFILDGLYPRVQNDPAKLAVLLANRKRSGLLVPDPKNSGRRVWILSRIEELASDAKVEVRASARRRFWQFVASLKDVKEIRLFEYTPDQEGREVRVTTNGAVFVLRTSVERRAVKTWMDSKDWHSLQTSVFEFTPRPGIGEADF